MADRKLIDIFGVPPISVLDVKQKYWKERKQYWLSLGIESEICRKENLLSLSPLLKSKHNATSIFDPVLCEIMYRWFTNENDLIYDPFYGGSVRGIVASKLKRKYHGCDIRREQIESNISQSKTICDSHYPTFLYIDSIINNPEKYDFFFTCPPYYNLEIYSDLDNDLSNMSVEDFDRSYDHILSKSLANLQENRFAAIVIGDVRDTNGNYLNFVSKTIDIFIKNELVYYNDMILLQEPATAAMRSFNYMNSSRKIAKCHQNVLVFVKGEVNKAVERLNKFEDNMITNLESLYNE